jgi:signal peptide peptidase SppA
MPKGKHQIRHVRAALFDQPWAIHQPTLNEMLAVLDESPQAAEQRLGVSAETDSRMQINNGVALIPIVGVLQPKSNVVTRWYGGTSTAQVEADFKRALADNDVKSIVFLVDSPGGSATGNEEVAQTILAARGMKPITAFVRGMAASAAYYLASAAERMVATPSSSVGSIGTIYVHADYSKMFEEFGVQVTNVTHGKHKADGSPYVKFDKQSQATIQEYVDAFGNQFVAAVARHRGMTPAAVMEKFGQGKVFLADQAKQLGMIDAVGSMDEVMVPPDEADDELEDATPFTGVAAVHGARPAVPFDLSSPWSVVATNSTKPTKTHESPSAATAANHHERSKTMDRIRAALFARGLIDDANASDEVVNAVLAGYFRGNVPENEEKILEAINSGQMDRQETQAQQGQQSQASQANSEGAAANVQQAHDREIEEARTQAIAQDRERRQNIESAGQLLGMSQDDIRAAIESDDSDHDIVMGWHRQLAERESPVSNTSVNVREGGQEQFVTDVTDALLLRSGYEASSEQPSNDAQRLQNAPLSYIAQQCLQMAGRRVDPYADAEQTALAAMQMAGAEVVTISASGIAYNRPGDFPNLLSNLAGKMLDQAIQIAEPTYPIWTARMADLPDFKPKTIVGIGNFDELDQLTDDEDPSALAMNEEMGGWIQAGRYGNKIGLTPVMVANDDLDAFTQGLMSLAMAHEHTLNRLCLALIGGNVTMADGNSLFDDTNHGNDVESGQGGVPSQAQMEKMRLKHRTQTGIGGIGKVRTPAKFALVPPQLEEDALQTLLPLRFLPEQKVPVTDATINIFRGAVTPVVEPDLADYSTAYWYTMADPRVRRTIVHAFQRGFGRGGKRTRWFDPARKTMYVDIEGRFAAAAVSYRGIVRNIGA